MAVAMTVVSAFKGLSADMNPFVSLKRLSPSLLRRKGVMYLGEGLPSDLEQSSEVVKATGEKSDKKGVDFLKSCIKSERMQVS